MSHTCLSSSWNAPPTRPSSPSGAVALNGRDAKAAIDNIEPVDVVVLDLMLPYISGFQLIIEMREHPNWANVPIVVVSGKVLEEDIVRALNLGANDYVTKPFRPEELLARLRRVVRDNERIKPSQ